MRSPRSGSFVGKHSAFICAFRKPGRTSDARPYGNEVMNKRRPRLSSPARGGVAGACDGDGGVVSRLRRRGGGSACPAGISPPGSSVCFQAERDGKFAACTNSPYLFLPFFRRGKHRSMGNRVTLIKERSARPMKRRAEPSSYPAKSRARSITASIS